MTPLKKQSHDTYPVHPTRDSEGILPRHSGDEWEGDPRFADFPVLKQHHGVNGVDDENSVTAVRPDLRIVDVELFNAVLAMRHIGRSGGRHG